VAWRLHAHVNVPRTIAVVSRQKAGERVIATREVRAALVGMRLQPTTSPNVVVVPVVAVWIRLPDVDDDVASDERRTIMRRANVPTKLQRHAVCVRRTRCVGHARGRSLRKDSRRIFWR